MLAGFIVGAKLISGYLTNSIQRTKINNSYSSWGEILFGAQQEIILGPTLFTIFLEDLFLAIDEAEFASYDADNTIYYEGARLDEAILLQQDSAKNIFLWFSHNQMKGNTGKCHIP